MNIFSQWSRSALQSLRPMLHRGTEQYLLNFNEHSSVPDWRVWCDSVLSGYSTVNVSFSSPQPPVSNAVSPPSNSVDSPDNDISLIFQGSLSTKWKRSNAPEPFDEKVIRSGFAACSYNLPRHLRDISDFTRFKIKFRSDGRSYNLNLRPASFFIDDLYQCKLNIKPQDKNKWLIADIPLDSLILIGQGRIKEQQRDFDHGMLENIGFSISDNLDGEFKLEVSWFKAVR